MDANYVIDFLTGKLPYTMELTILGQAFSGAMAVKGGRNKFGELHWFHAFVLSVLIGFSGGLFNFLWMGRPTSMISNDVVFASCVVAFVFVNYIPFGFKLTNLLPIKIVITMFAMLFRSLGLCGFVSAAFNTFKESPSAYYPIPIFGPIWYGIMLGNMGGFVLRGVDGYLAAGVPWPFQNGIFCAPLFHFYAHDKSGPVGDALRNAIAPLHALLPDLDDRAFAVAFVSLFMQVVGILQLPAFLGPSFSPFVVVHKLINAPLEAALSKDKRVHTGVSRGTPKATPESKKEETPQAAPSNKRRNKKSKNKRKKA